MSFDHFAWLSTGSTERPMILTFRLSNSGLILAMYPSSVVHTGVKSRGWEKSTPQESPSHSWNLIFPSVVSASKSGAVSPSCSAMWSPWFEPLRTVEPTLRDSGGRTQLALRAGERAHHRRVELRARAALDLA